MDPRTKYKVDKYVSKLKNAKSPEEANMYQAKLRFYHRKNQAGGSWFGGDKPEVEKEEEKEESIKELLKALGDRIERCDEALKRLESMNIRMSAIEEKFKELNIKHDPVEKSVEDNLSDNNQKLLDRIASLEREVKELKDNKSQNQFGGSNEIILDMSSAEGEEFSNSMFALFN